MKTVNVALAPFGIRTVKKLKNVLSSITENWENNFHADQIRAYFANTKARCL